MKEILNKFDDIIKRMILPTSMFIVLLSLVLFSKYGFNDKVFQYMKQISWWEYGILFIGISYILSIFSQMIFDNVIKKNYNSELFIEDNNNLKLLKKKVCCKLFRDNTYKKVKDRELNDYLLYQILGKKYEVSGRYVDDTKAIGILFLSIMINLIILFFIFMEGQNNYSVPLLGYATFLSIVVIYNLGYEAIKAKYRSRAIRLYVNYLIDEKKDEEKDEENKNCIIECEDIKNMIDKFIKKDTK